MEHDDKYHSAFDNLITLNDMIINKAHSMLKESIEEDNALILTRIHAGKPSHFTDDDWEDYKKLGERLLKI